MKVIYLERGRGKTRQLIEKSARTGFYIVCSSRRACSQIFEEAGRLDFAIPFPITHYDFKSGQYCGKGVTGFLIDDVDMLLHGMTSIPIEVITLTKDEGFCKVDCIRESGYPCVHIEECRKKEEINSRTIEAMEVKT